MLSITRMSSRGDELAISSSRRSTGRGLVARTAHGKGLVLVSKLRVLLNEVTVPVKK